VDVKIHSFLTSAQEESRCLPAQTNRFAPKDKSVGTIEFVAGCARGGSTSCLPRSVRNCISCVQVVCFTRIRCVPTCQPHAYELHRNLWVYKVFNNLKVLP